MIWSSVIGPSSIGFSLGSSLGSIVIGSSLGSWVLGSSLGSPALFLVCRKKEHLAEVCLESVFLKNCKNPSFDFYLFKVNNGKNNGLEQCMRSLASNQERPK